MFLDYETLRIIWWLILGGTLVGFAISNGFSLGVATLMPFVARTDEERAAVARTMDLAWDGIQAWYLLAGVAILAAWPPLHDLAFSGFFFVMFAVVLALILRSVGFGLRGRVNHPVSRALWDVALCVSGFVPILAFGVSVGNVLQGVPFHVDASLRPVFDGGFLGLFNPFAVLTGCVAVALLCMHGGCYLALRTGDALADRARVAAAAAAMALIFLFAVSGLWAGLGMDGYAIVEGGAHDGPSGPMAKKVDLVANGWFQSYVARLPAVFASAVGLIAPLAVVLLLDIRMTLPAFIASCAAVAGVVAACGLTMFPFLVPSSTHPSMSLTVWDSSAGPSTLFNMLIAVAVLLPIVVGTAIWAYKRMRRADSHRGAAP